jgi:hypothetical protein
MTQKPQKQKTPKLDFSLMSPYALQREIIEHPARFKIVSFGRQSGKSWLAKRVLLEEAANNGKRCWWVSPTLTAAQDHWTDLTTLLIDSGVPVRKINNSTKTIEFHSGGSIRVRSAEIPNHLRGGTLDFLVLDEAAFMVEDVWSKILQATLTASRGSALFLSTPNGQNWFYKLFKLGQNDKYPMYKSWSMPSTAAPYQDHEMLEIIRQTTPEMVWREEYLAEFLADSGGVFAGLDRVSFRPMLLKPVSGHVYVAGVDWGLDDDYTVFTIIDKYSREQVFGMRFNAIGTIPQIDVIEEQLRIWKPEIIHIEKNGVGEPMFKLIRERLGMSRDDEEAYGGHGIGGFYVGGQFHEIKVRGVHMDNKRKRKIIETLAADIEFGRFSPLVKEDENDVESFGAIQMGEMSTFARKRTASGLEITYSAPEGDKDDTVMGLAIAYMGVTPYEVEQRQDRIASPKTNKNTRIEKRSPFHKPVNKRGRETKHSRRVRS